MTNVHMQAVDLLPLVLNFWTASAFFKVVLKPIAEQFLSKDSDSKRSKFVNTAWRLCAYVFLISLTMMASREHADWFWSPTMYHEPYPHGTLPKSVTCVYHVQTAFYLFSLASMFFEPAMKDFWMMFGHHVFTLTLLFTSFRHGATKYGMAIILLHDLADPLLELAKLVLYTGNEMLANLVFGLFALVFVITRDYAYPRYILWNTWFQLEANNYKHRHLTMTCLISLWLLHLFWTLLIFKVAAKALTGKQEGDIREDDE